MLKKTENNDIIFEAGEDLYSHQKTTLLLLSQTSFRIQITKSRKIQSYSFEFCGMTGLSYKTLRFQSLGRDISPDLIITTPCLIKVNQKNQKKLEFFLLFRKKYTIIYLE